MAFEDYTEYVSSNFELLNKRVSKPSDQKKYIDSWKSKYAAHFKSNPPEENFLWNIRVHKALKEIFTASTMYQESLIAKESRSWTSFCFLSYYSLFHGLLSCAYLLPSENINKLSEITHTKLLNIFKSNFVSAKPNIIDEGVCEAFVVFKYLREYYSYHMPPNHFLYEYEDNIKPDFVLPTYLKSCFQLSSLLSEIIESSFKKHHKKIPDRYSFYDYVREHYCKVNSREHPVTKKHLLHYVDEVRLRETFEYPAPVPFVIELEHFTDEFGLYEDAEFSRFANGDEISPSGFVYDAIC
ncbi:hypothetical protein [Marinobacterium stanieri]|uniref:Uncharacterized protein n=1 Tax=Marinobacterium stanieri TaxID=49186 RepID=A0A1N6THG3_9GAMM|nr:hypothetical protein [Marinobacterium stanieri]SIQ52701.1 hypothetical protein SAMN05421647_105337 [Marinobacterium stanieri]